MVDDFDLDNLPAVRLSDREKLPTTAGIYFASDSSKRLLYIGKAQNLRKRWMNHHRYHQLAEIDKRDSITLRWYECKDDAGVLSQLENYFIETYHPAFNQTKVELKKVTPAEIAEIIGSEAPSLTRS